MDIHGQYDNQYLLHPENHIKILDDFGFESLSKLKTEMSLSYKNYVSIRKKLKALLDKQKTFQENSDFVKYQLKELKGQYEDEETGLYYNRFRYYDPSTGAYISQDPIGLAGGSRLYGYVHDTNS